MRTKRYMYARSKDKPWLLFDLQNDPWEQHNLVDDPARQAGWYERLAPYYEELGLDPRAPKTMGGVYAFDQAMCDLVVEFQPGIVSFHFGLPDKPLLTQVKDSGAKVISSATTVEEARWLEAQGCDAALEIEQHRS